MFVMFITFNMLPRVGWHACNFLSPFVNGFDYIILPTYCRDFMCVLLHTFYLRLECSVDFDFVFALESITLNVFIGGAKCCVINLQ